MPRENVTLTTLFADIAESTLIYDKLGNKEALKVVGSCLSLLSEAVIKNGGSVIKTIGDAIMCTFENVDNAVLAAVEMNRNLAEMPFICKPGIHPPNIYVGLQRGPVIREDEDVFGDAVNVAATAVNLAKQRQIVTTEETVEALNSELKKMARYIDEAIIKGKPGGVKIYEIMWEQKDETVMVDVPLDALVTESRMALRIGNKIIEVGQSRPKVTLGRQKHNDVVVDDIRVSRTHARIEYRRGKILLIDQSKNGTYAIIQGGKIISLRRDEALLSGSGIISLGREMVTESTVEKLLIHFETIT